MRNDLVHRNDSATARPGAESKRPDYKPPKTTEKAIRTYREQAYDRMLDVLTRLLSACNVHGKDNAKLGERIMRDAEEIHAAVLMAKDSRGTF